MDILATVSPLRPGFPFTFKRGCEQTYSNVIVADIFAEPVTLPTLEECQTHWEQTLKNKYGFERLRKRRDTLLTQTDKYIVADYPHADETAKQAWLDYRQALRDLPATTEDPTNPEWPTQPSP